MEPYKPLDNNPTWKTLWKLKVAPRTHLLMWNILFDKIPTCVNLMKRSFRGPFWCQLCRNDEKSIEHLFLNCPISKEQWNFIIAHYPFLKNWQGMNILDAWSLWCEKHNGEAINMPLLYAGHCGLPEINLFLTRRYLTGLLS